MIKFIVSRVLLTRTYSSIWRIKKSALFTEEELAENGDLVSKYFKSHKEAVRNVTLDLGTRLDGRKTTEIRDIWCEVDYLPSVHGSALFTRGETQALATATLGTLEKPNWPPSQQGEENSTCIIISLLLYWWSSSFKRNFKKRSRNLAQRALKIWFLLIVLIQFV
jgi:hypothetical protein